MTPPDPFTFAPRRLRQLAASLAVAVAGGFAAPGIAATLDTAACDADAFATVLHAAPEAPTDASACWLDRQRLQWPGQVADDGALFKLYHATDGGMTAGVGSAVSGTDGAIGLQVAG